MFVFKTPNEIHRRLQIVSLVKYQVETMFDGALGPDVRVVSMLVGGHVEPHCNGKRASEIFVFASNDGAPTEGVTSTSWLSGGFWSRKRRTHTLFLIGTTAGTPPGEEVVDQLLILILLRQQRTSQPSASHQRKIPDPKHPTSPANTHSFALEEDPHSVPHRDNCWHTSR